MQLIWAKKLICSMTIFCAAGLLVVGTGCPAMPTPDPPPGQTLDADGDGVTDANDDCANTPAATMVDATGCPVGATDADGDGILNDDDQCADTPANTTVDATGCSIVSTDVDGDGVNNDVDECANTPEGAIVDEVGCPVSTVDTDADGDGVNDDIDQCPNTAEGVAVDANGCAADERDSDMDGVLDSADQCMGTPRGANVDASGCPLPPPGGGGGPPPGSVCGNSVVESGEQCDPPDGSTCDGNCQTTSGGMLTNDSCLTPIAIGEGDRSFSTTDATTDGPDETDAPVECSLDGDTQVASDIWYLYTATCSNLVIVSLCGSLYDTKLMIYEGSGCPVDAMLPVACSDDDCGPGANARAIFTAETGLEYMIRIGGFRGEQGDGTLTIYCGNDPGRGLAACGAGAGECFMSNGSPGCDVVTACNQTCLVDPFCCDTDWDQTCSNKADGIVNGFTACEGSTNACKLPSPSGVGCDVPTCCQLVCEQDSFCCTTNWDDVCAQQAGIICP